MEYACETAKNGEKTCLINGKYLHSKYNPSLEGEKFAASLAADFSPLCVLILEPALSYSAKFLRIKFPHAKICCVRFFEDFKDYDSLWDCAFYGADENFCNLGKDLYNAFGEEILMSTLVFDWQPSKNIFPNENLICWQEIKKAILNARDILGTRSYFSKRWLKNSVQFCKKINSGFIFDSSKHGTFQNSKPVLLAASGPSLKSSLPFIKKYREIFFLIAVSSALLPLVSSEIEPDLTISSDGGFWAKRHLALISDSKKNSGRTFGIEAEGACFSEILENNELVPFCYADGLEQALLQSIGCPFILTKRNGTVAGTALEFAFSFTDGKIFLAGFDQAPAPGFQHTQPNALENISQKNDFRLSTKETRLTKSRFASEKTLEIYRNWFVSNSQKFSQRVFRISDDYNFPFSLGKIRDINWKNFEKISETQNISSEKNGQNQIARKYFKLALPQNERKKRIISKLKELSSFEFFISEVFPLDSLLLKREINEEKKLELKKKLDEKIRNLLKEIEEKI